MKKSLDHLPEDKQAELEDILSIILKSSIKPEIIILFGSFARGDWVEDRYQDKSGTIYEYKSDFDIFIVVESQKQVCYKKPWQKLNKKISESTTIQTRASIVNHSIELLNKELTKGHYFYIDIKKEGILLYDSGKYVLSDPVELHPSARKGKATEHFKYWMKKALSFNDLFEFTYQKDDYSMAAFMLHQTAESLFTAILLVFTDYRPKTHDLEQLRSLVNGQNPRFIKVFPNIGQEEKRLFELLRKSYVDARYDRTFKIHKEELQWLNQQVEILKALTEEICMEKIARFCSSDSNN